MNNKRGGESRLGAWYYNEAAPRLKEVLGLSNIMEVPKISKIVLNIGVKRSVGDNKTFQLVEKTLGEIAGQAPVKTLARKSIASFKIRDGMPVGVCVTLRHEKMYTFLDKLISLSLPKVRDFQGVPTKFDGRGNYNLGIKEWGIFPEADDLSLDSVFGLNVTIHTTAISDQQGYELLKMFGMPFKKK